MHVLLVGGGLIGVSTAWALLERGHTVELFEARDALAEETSHANGGMLTAGMCEPWNAPGVWKDLLTSLFDPKSAMKLHPSAVPGLALWGLRFLAQSTPQRFEANTRASYSLCSYSIATTSQWVREQGLNCDYRDPHGEAPASAGDMKIFPSTAAAEFSLQLVELLKPLGLRADYLDRDAVLAKEPNLEAIAEYIACGLVFPDDAAGDACRFTRELGERVQRAGGKIHTGQRVNTLIEDGGRITGLRTDDRGHSKSYRGDAVVVCAASSSPRLTAAHGVRLPIKPVKGYSLTIDAAGLESPPQIGVINQAMHAAVNPIGSRLRVAGTAEFTRSHKPVLSPARVENLWDLLTATYPRIAVQLDFNNATPWCGFRPMSVDGLPYIGSTAMPGLLVNSGHGYLGWTQAAGSAELLADQLEGKASKIDPSPYRVER